MQGWQTCSAAAAATTGCGSCDSYDSLGPRLPMPCVECLQDNTAQPTTLQHTGRVYKLYATSPTAAKTVPSSLCAPADWSILLAELQHCNMQALKENRADIAQRLTTEGCRAWDMHILCCFLLLLGGPACNSCQLGLESSEGATRSCCCILCDGLRKGCDRTCTVAGYTDDCRSTAGCIDADRARLSASAGRVGASAQAVLLL